MALSENDIKEELSCAYIHAISSICGYTCERDNKDRLGIDLRIHGKGNPRNDELLNCEIAIQAKSTSGDVSIVDGKIKYDLKVGNYKVLIEENSCPSLLVLFVMPEDKGQWLSHSVESLISRKCAYWCSLLGQADTDNIDTIRIDVPIANVLSPSALVELMGKAARGEQI